MIDRCKALRWGVLAAALLLLAGASPADAQVKTPVKLVRGAVYDSRTKQPITDGGKMWAYEERESTSVSSSKVNAGTGAFQMLLDPVMGYRFRVKTPGHFITDYYFCTPGGLDYQELDTIFYIDPIPIGATIYEGRLFEPNSAELRVTADLRNLVDLLKTNQSVAVDVTVTPDFQDAPPPPPPPPAKKGAKPKKLKKGEAPPPPAPVAPVTPQMTEQEKTELAKKRADAVKEFMKQQKVSVTRLNWQFGQPVNLAHNADRSTFPTNVQIKIKEIRTDEEDNDSDSDY